MQLIELDINGRKRQAAIDEKWNLLYVLREVFDLTGTKCGCNTGDCGACKVIIDGTAVNACMVRAVNAQGKKITTIEGLTNGAELHPIQQAFIDCGAVQCGFCIPGMIICAKALLDQNPSPSEEEIRKAISGNLCRCTGYVKIVEAIQEAARRLRGEAPQYGLSAGVSVRPAEPSADCKRKAAAFDAASDAAGINTDVPHTDSGKEDA